jgi:hypothetical protein
MRSDNTLESARRLGKIGIGGAKTRRIQNFLGQSDQADFYRFSLVGSKNRASALADFETQQGAYRVAIGFENLKGRITFPKKSTLTVTPEKGLQITFQTSFQVNGEEDSSGRASSTLYFKVFRPTQNLNYRFSITYQELD